MEDDFSFSDLIKKAREHTVPLHATVELLSQCNLHCEHCYIPRHIAHVR